MRKICKLLLFLFGISLLMQAVFVFFGKGYEITYTVKDDEKSFLVKETYRANQKGKDNYYQFLIADTFSFTVFDNLHKDSKLIKQVYYYENDNYKCIYPVFKKEKVQMDVMCKGDTLLYYHTMKGKDSGVDQFVESLKGYRANAFVDTKETVQEERFVKVYQNNLQENHFITLQTYKGIYSIKKDKKRSIGITNYYDHDVYDPTLSAATSHYYVTSTYSGEFDFDGFYVIDMVSNSKKKIESKVPISYNSYIQGTVGTDVYLLDKNSQKQYKIDSKKKTMMETGNAEKGIQYYEDGKWTEESISQSLRSERKFPSKIMYQNEAYSRIEKSNNFYYLFRNRNGNVEVNRTPIYDTSSITYLFTASDVNHVKYVKDFLYFFENGEIKYYSDQTGVKTVASYSEMNFNKGLNYYIHTN